MSDEGVPCYRRMSAPMGERDLAQAVNLLRDACAYVRKACGILHYMESCKYGSLLLKCASQLETVARILYTLAYKPRVRVPAKGNQVTFGTIDEWEPGSAEEASKSTDQ